MRLLIPGTKATEVPAESAQREPLTLESSRRHDAVLQFYGLVDARATPEPAQKTQNPWKGVTQ